MWGRACLEAGQESASRWLLRCNVAFVVIFLCVFPTGAAFGEKSHVIVDAILLPLSEYQPSEIALVNKERKKTIHVSTGRAIIGLSTGTYRIDHIHMRQRVFTSPGTVWLDDEDSLNFTVVPDAITLVGVVQLERTGEATKEREYSFDVSVSMQEQALAWACERHKKIVERNPVRILQSVGKYKTVNVNCVPAPTLE